MKYPKSLYFIVSAEIGERFCTLGLQTTLSLYFVDVLLYSQKTATILFHAFVMLVLLCSLLGGVLADSWLNLYRSLLFLSVLNIFGNILMFASTIPLLNLPVREISMISLLLIALGTGGIKPCCSTFGAEQFELPKQQAQLSSYFSLHIFVVHLGALLSSFLLPILRKDFTCFDQNTCYSLVYLTTTIVMLIATVVFYTGKKYYKIRKPQKNVALHVAKCIFYAGYKKIISNKKQVDWLELAEDRYDKRTIKDIKIMLSVLKLLIPFPLYWALSYQIGSRWTFQATNMNGEFFGYLIKPDQFQLVDPLLAIILIPIFQIYIYPFMDKFFFTDTPLKKLSLALMLTSLSFIASGILQLKLEPLAYTVQPSSSLTQIRIFNTINCRASVNINDEKFTLEGLDLYENLSIPVKGNTSLNFIAEYNNCPLMDVSKFIISGELHAQESKATTWALTNSGLSPALPDRITKSRSGDPLIRALIHANSNFSSNVILELQGSKRNYRLTVTKELGFSKFIEINPDKYDLWLNKKMITENQSIRSGGVYTIVGHISNNTKIVRIITIVQPNSVHIFWQLPQYILIATGQIIVHVTGLKFMFDQSPNSMKSMLCAFWFFAISIGNLIVIIIAKAQLFERQALEIFLFAFLMMMDMLIFISMSKSYKYVEISSDDSVNEVLNQQSK